MELTEKEKEAYKTGWYHAEQGRDCAPENAYPEDIGETRLMYAKGWDESMQAQQNNS